MLKGVEMTVKKPFSLYTRTPKNGKPVYYVKYRLPDGSWGTGRSTGQNSKYRAEAHCIEYLQTGGIVAKEKVTLEEYSRNFFQWTGRWAIDKRVRGLRLRERQCIELDRTLKNLVLPVIGNMRLTDIDRSVIKNFRNNLFNKNYAGSTINHALLIIKAILEAAEEQSLIRGIPRIDRAANNTKHKGILTIDETKSLFKAEWADFRAYTASLLAAASGLWIRTE